jgi:tetrahydromethanopterin S-methyltransferase subunit G
MDEYRKVEKRLTKVERLLDTIANNHLKHIEMYTRWTLYGVCTTWLIAMLALGISLWQ